MKKYVVSTGSALVAAIALFPGAALAHAGSILHTHGFVAGVLHMAGGADHLAAAVVTGLALSLWRQALARATLLLAGIMVLAVSAHLELHVPGQGVDAGFVSGLMAATLAVQCISFAMASAVRVRVRSAG